MEPPAPPRPAATILLLRDGAAGLEVWLMERARTTGFMASAWVFPGGRVDPEDEFAAAVGGDVERVPRHFWVAAARELHEEAGVALRDGVAWDLRGMRVWAHWVTPEVEPRRYDTWFFAARLPAGAEAKIDGQEASRGGWYRPAAALELSEGGELPVAPPTLRTLVELLPYADVEAVLQSPRHTPPIMPKFLDVAGTLHVLLPGDPDHPSAERVDPPWRYAFSAGRWWASP
ncbi:MAG: NUDIX hydrolase [Myxococcales bacterium]|nr:NUDIX hydrolase [Myxococcales bacterium]